MATEGLGRNISKLWLGETNLRVVPAISTTPEVVARIVCMVLTDLGATVEVHEERVVFSTFYLALASKGNPLLPLRSGVIDVFEMPNGVSLRIRFKIRFMLLFVLLLPAYGASAVSWVAVVLVGVFGAIAFILTRVGATSGLERRLRIELAPEHKTGG